MYVAPSSTIWESFLYPLFSGHCLKQVLLSITSSGLCSFSQSLMQLWGPIIGILAWYRKPFSSKFMGFLPRQFSQKFNRFLNCSLLIIYLCSHFETFFPPKLEALRTMYRAIPCTHGGYKDHISHFLQFIDNVSPKEAITDEGKFRRWERLTEP